MNSYDAVVIGAGPAGAMSALLLARAGVKTLLVEKNAFPRYKVCGCCLAPAGQGVLDRNGAGDVLNAAVRVETLVVRHRNGTTCASVPAYRVIERGVMDARLGELAQSAGCEVLTGTAARAERNGTAVLRSDAGERSVRARAVLCADGLAGSSVRGWDEFAWSVRPGSRVGVGCVTDSAGGVDGGAITMGVGRDGYCGVAPLGNGRWALAAAIDAGAVRERTAGGAVRGVLDDAGMGGVVLPAGGLVGVPTLTRTRAQCEAELGDGGRVFLVGDSAGYIEPFTGEGMSWALRSAELCSVHAMCVIGGSYARGQWTRDVRRVIGREKLGCKVVTGVLRRPRLTGLCARAARWSPALSSAIARKVVAA